MSDRKVYVFLMSRPCDKGDTWPVVFTDRERAEAAEHRISEVAEVCFAASVGAPHLGGEAK